MGIKRQRVEFELSDARETDAPDPTVGLELANFAAIPGDVQQPEEGELLPEPEEPFPANFDRSDLFAYVLLQSTITARTRSFHLERQLALPHPREK